MKDRVGDGEAWANLLVCPVCRCALRPDSAQAPNCTDSAQALSCTGCGRSYPVVDGIAQLLADEAEPDQQAKADRQAKAGGQAKADRGGDGSR